MFQVAAGLALIVAYTGLILIRAENRRKALDRMPDDWKEDQATRRPGYMEYGDKT